MAVANRCSNGKVHRTVRIRPEFSFAYFVVLATVLGACIVGCDPETRHRYLTYFVDGVPPLGAEKDAQDDAESTQRTGQARPGDVEKIIWFAHKPWEESTSRQDCRTKCHKPPGDQIFGASTILLKPVPELCFGCHEDMAVAELYVHGPKIAGECIFCHEAHKSRIEGLLKKKQPELCYQCHELLEAEPIPEHPDDPEIKCTKCHDPHGGSERYFLRNETESEEI